MNTFVGNSSSQADLQTTVALCGTGSPDLVMEPNIGRPRGFAFLKMRHSYEPKNVIFQLDGSDLCRPVLSVSSTQSKAAGGRGLGGHVLSIRS